MRVISKLLDRSTAAAANGPATDARNFLSEPSGLLLGVVLSAIVALLFLSVTLSHLSSREVHRLAEALVTNSTRSIERLLAIPAASRDAETALRALLDEAGADRSHENDGFVEARDRLRGSVDWYLQIAELDGEAVHTRAVRDAWLELDRELRAARVLAMSGRERDARVLLDEVIAEAELRLSNASTEAAGFHTRTAREFASRIQASRRRTLRVANGMAIACALLAVAGGILLQRQAIRRRASARSYAALLEERTEELEQFAGRVAHDIRSPIATARVNADVLLLRTKDESMRDLIGRIERSLLRVEAITAGLLSFARAGAKPDPGARASPREIIGDMAEAFDTDARQSSIEFRVEEPIPPAMVACSDGVYMSMLGNFARNAIKHMGDSEVRRIVVRVRERGALVRTEVTDTGPGIPAKQIPSLFEPYFRGTSGAREGIGLGLATVRKLAVGHGGRVGVDSSEGCGSTFWFELPRAGSEVDSARRPAEPSPRFPTGKDGDAGSTLPT